MVACSILMMGILRDAVHKLSLCRSGKVLFSDVNSHNIGIKGAPGLKKRPGVDFFFLDFGGD